MTYHLTRAAARRDHFRDRAAREIRASNEYFEAANALAYGRPGCPFALLAVHSQGGVARSHSVIDAALLKGIEHAQKALGNAARSARWERRAGQSSRHSQPRPRIAMGPHGPIDRDITTPRRMRSRVSGEMFDI